MKQLILILFILIIVQSVFAQINYGTDSATCVTKYQIYRNDYNNKNYEEAMKNWRWIFNECPKYNENTFVNGPKIITYQIKKDNESKGAYIDTLMMIYNQRISFIEDSIFFGRRSKVLGSKGIDLLKYYPDKYIEVYHILRESIDGERNAASSLSLITYFKALVEYEKNSEDFTKQDIFDAYIDVSEIIAYNLENNEKYAKNYEKALIKVENWFAPYASCDDLIKMFKERLEGGIDDISLLKKITSLLDKKDCTENEVYDNAVTQLHELDPTAESAYKMGNNSIAKKNYSDAVSYYNQAIQLQEDINYKASYYLKLAYAYQMKRSYSDARSAANSAADLKPEWGESYLMLGDIYASSSASCGSSSLENRSVFWVAVDMFSKAKSIDNVLTEKANKKISFWSKQFPSKEDCIWEDLSDGDTYKVGCWIGRSTRVRTRN